jgi:hypothetical protein
MVSLSTGKSQCCNGVLCLDWRDLIAMLSTDRNGSTGAASVTQLLDQQVSELRARLKIVRLQRDVTRLLTGALVIVDENPVQRDLDPRPVGFHDQVVPHADLYLCGTEGTLKIIDRSGELQWMAFCACH